MVKKIDTLVDDIYALFMDGHECDPDNVEALGKSIGEAVAKGLRRSLEEKRAYKLYMSAIGKPERQIWYDAHPEASPEPETLEAPARIKFLFGDILERLLLFLTVEAGHELTHSQERVEIDGCSGKMDGRIDGVLVDAKSASTFSFKKFKTGELRQDDAFGYMWQLAGYSEGDHSVPETTDAGFLVIDKTLGNICYMPVPKEEFKLYNVKKRIARLHEIIALPEPPERCYEDEPDGKSGNMKLGVGCSYCKHKAACWPDLQTFIYAGGPRFLTKVVRQPKVDQKDI